MFNQSINTPSINMEHPSHQRQLILLNEIREIKFWDRNDLILLNLFHTSSHWSRTFSSLPVSIRTTHLDLGLKVFERKAVTAETNKTSVWIVDTSFLLLPWQGEPQTVVYEEELARSKNRPRVAKTLALTYPPTSTMTYSL
ncbi:hypothetical protein F2Q69_00036111 [Brassica cretica]|uniref:Uncharacterized protein n=1 Tax=Brassica cretica TaxID=69181 RepID=A0A8S9SN02_BRACR|nr:hypothetical protein F2Q69_00036111 [Brassica cretica]